MEDYLGQKLEVGDRVLRIHGGRGTGYFGYAKVIGFTPQKVKLQSYRRHWSEPTYSGDQKSWGITNLDPQKIVKMR